MARYANLFSGGGAVDLDSALEPDTSRKGQAFTLLFVDDEAGVLSAMQRIFMEENYAVLTATSAEKALTILERQPVQLVISDHRMPGMTGAELLKAIKEKWPETIRIMLTGHADVNSIMGAVQDGAVYKFITKPWNDEDLRLTVSLALQQYVLQHENRKLRELARTQQQKIRTYAGIFDENRGVMGKILVHEGLLRQEELERVRTESTDGEFLSDAIVRLGLATESRILKALQSNLKIEYIDLREVHLQPAAVKFLPRDLCEKSRILPVKLDGRQLTLAMADPSDVYKCDNIAMLTGLKVTPLLAGSSEILAQLRTFYGERDVAAYDDTDDIDTLEPLDEIDIVIDDDDTDVSISELVGSSEVPPIIRIVNAIISEAVRYRASDIHIEPKTKCTLIRYRVDGMLHSKIKVPIDLHPAVVSRIKILAKMDISERRRPQDGRITVKTGTRLVDMRVSCLPTINGEKIVLRMLDKSSAIKSLKDLGVLPADLARLEIMARRPQGVIISTGPTGSGKTTMLYSILASIMDPSKNFETIEEPVEYFLEEASQVAVREKIGLTFAQVLRSTLRQDPDVILVGEMRDFETADVAFKAALTGHLVFTTLHTNSSVASITRLMDMEIKPYIIASALQGIIAQRLVRRICPDCRQEGAPDPEQLRLLKLSAASLLTASKGMGCAKCNGSGYLGRIGIFELFVMTDDYRQQISSNYHESDLVQMARLDGMRTLMEDGLEKVRMGLTTLDELLRMLGPQTSNERTCEQCQRIIDGKFIFCPHCGAFRNNYCHTCRLPLEEEWTRCPFCGQAKQHQSCALG
jgi:type II secretory ATPase GspE/PulE/Tfp pilus assembly ATPase PilB-like protein/FixJ family two-component response regulator/RNA polymerase subunit RPABC4/transcription elongation factor Spt4